MCFLRLEISRPRKASEELPPFAFTVVTTKRHWTLCADCQAGALQWLRMISVAVDEDVAVVDDAEALFHVKAHWSANGDRYGPETIATAHIGSMGMELKLECVDSALVGSNTMWGRGGGRTGKREGGWRSATCDAADDRLRFWSFTDFYKWTVVDLQKGNLGLALQCFVDDQFTEKEVCRLS